MVSLFIYFRNDIEVCMYSGRMSSHTPALIFKISIFIAITAQAEIKTEWLNWLTLEQACVSHKLMFCI